MLAYTLWTPRLIQQEADTWLVLSWNTAGVGFLMKGGTGRVSVHLGLCSAPRVTDRIAGAGEVFWQGCCGLQAHSPALPCSSVGTMMRPKADVSGFSKENCVWVFQRSVFPYSKMLKCCR